ncbi:MAG: AAA family ATPase [Candidatus Rokubacteria bacterium]|nr:AAA family ATPase [Candidatus Rokubacteria bacterium]
MKCPRCEQETPADAQFCPECGAKLAVVCTQCGTPNAPAHNFCKTCGQPLAVPAGPGWGAKRFGAPDAYVPKHLAEKILTSRSVLEGERKQVTVLFADLKGSMELLADRDPEDARKLLDPVLERMMEAVHRYEGTVNQVMGDGVMALFGAPLAHEDHAVRACYAALRMQEAVSRYGEEVRRAAGVPIHIRVGLNSGEVVVRSIGSDLHMDYTAVGQTTHLAARMEQAALPGSILISAETLRLAEGYVQVKPLGPIPVKGLSEPVEAYEVIGTGVARFRLQAAAARGLTRFVGRAAELEHLRQALERAGAGHGQVAALVGEPGVGKSRLVWEFTHSHRTQDWLVLESGSVSYGKATPYLPVIDLLKAYCGIQDRDDQRQIREKLTGKLLTLDRALEPALPAFLALLDVPVEEPQWQALDPPQRRQRTLDAVKRLLLRESQVQPLLAVFEDLHWIDAETQALLDSLVESLPTARVLLVVNYRPEYEHRWGNKTYYTQLRLDPLPPESAEELLKALLGDDPGLQPLKGLLIDRTEGNPFFLEESVRTLVETGILVGERGAYRLAKALPTVQVPATVQALLAARIDRLPPDEKRLLQSASVIGKDVPFALLEAIAERPEPDLRRGLAHLQAAEFLYEVSLFHDLEYTFKHALTHEVAYGSLLQERRRELHRRAGEALERLFPDRTEEFYGVLARHFVESGNPAKGLDYSRRAAQKAVALFAHDEALRQYERVHACAAMLDIPEQLAAIEEAIGDVYHRRGMFERAVESYERTLVRTVAPERRAALTFKIGRVYAQFGGPRGVEFLHAALGELNPATQQNELAQATALLGRYRHYAGQHGQAIELLERARRLAEPLDDPETLTAIYGYLAGAYQHMARADESMEWARRCIALGERKKYPGALLTGSTFLAQDLDLLGRWDESLAFSARSHQVATQIGAEHRVAWAEHDRAFALHGKGELPAAAAAARMGLSIAEATGEPRVAVLLRSLLSRIETDLGEEEAAQAHARDAVAGAGALGDRALRCWSRHALAYFHLRREEWEPAAGLVAEWTELLAGTDHRLSRLTGGADCAEVVWGQGRLDAAEEMILTSVELAREAGSRHYEAVARRVHGQILVSRDRWDEAVRAFDDAVALLDVLGSRLELGRALYQRGLVHERRGEAERARADHGRAHAMFRETGAPRDRERAEQALALLPG